MDAALQGRKILLGVTGGIAAYKAAELCRIFVKGGAEVQVVMTAAARQFVQPMTFSALSRRPVRSDLWEASDEVREGHIALARWADVIVVAPATADFLAKVALGLGSDLLSTILLATRAPIVLAPAMNSTMLAHPATQAHLRTLAARPEVSVLDAPAGAMAEPEEGPGRLLEPEEIARAVGALLGPRDFTGRRVVVTAGPTREPVDPVRFVSNRSSGKMGYALASRAAWRGAKVTLVSGPSGLSAPSGVDLVRVETTEEMFEAVRSALPADAVIKAAAPADYRPADVSDQKIKKGQPEQALRLIPTRDILATLRAERLEVGVLVGFAAETENLLENARAKLHHKGLDLCVANLVGGGAGFDVDVNRVTLVRSDDSIRELPELPKSAVADAVLDEVFALMEAGGSHEQ